MRVLSAFGLLAAGLALVGLIGLVSLVVALRRRELGIRAALGVSLGGAAVLTLVGGLLACLLPAERASRVEPTTALRE